MSFKFTSRLRNVIYNKEDVRRPAIPDKNQSKTVKVFTKVSVYFANFFKGTQDLNKLHVFSLLKLVSKLVYQPTPGGGSDYSLFMSVIKQWK